jgi:cytosine/adenosine deaminase-related metal-dependent hydrolase
MLKIYDEQTEAFAQAAMREFEDRMAAHLQRFFRAECAQLGPEGLAELIRHGISRAASHGIVSEHDVALYLNLTVALGRDFDRDPLLPWASAALSETAALEPSRRMGRLYRATASRTQVPVPGDDAYVD